VQKRRNVIQSFDVWKKKEVERIEVLPLTKKGGGIKDEGGKEKTATKGSTGT